jgi:prepilin peptidase CpaA
LAIGLTDVTERDETMPSIEVWSEWVAVITGSIACVIDLKWRKIPNWLTLTTLGMGLVGHAVSGLWNELDALGGCLTGFALLAIPFLTGGIGGGDVKLLMALGALLGTVRVFWVFLYAGIAGGLFSLLYLIYRLGFSGACLRLRLMLETLGGRSKQATFAKLSAAQPLKIPYGVAIFTGLVWEVILKLGYILN